MRKLLFFIVCSSLSVQLSLAGLPLAFHFKNYTVDDGLPSNFIKPVCQDSRGYMWFGVGSSVCRFGGINSEIIKLKENTIQDNGIYNISSIVESEDGLLWIGTNIGVFTYSSTTSAVNEFPMTFEGEDVHPNITQIAIDKEFNLWFSTFDYGVFRFDPRSGTLKNYPLDNVKRISYSVFVDSDNNVWASAPSPISPLMKLDKNSDRFEIYNVTYSPSVKRSSVSLMYEDSNGNFWMGTWDGGLQKLDRFSKNITSNFDSNENYLYHIHAILETEKNILYIGSDNGLTIFDTRSNEYRQITPDLEKNSLSDGFVYSICKDAEGGVWLGTYYGGVNYIAPNGGFFDGNNCAGLTNSKFESIVSCFCEAPNGDIWIGTDNNGLIYYSPQTSMSKHYMPHEGNSLSYPNVHALCVDGDDLWIGTYAGGLNKLDTRTGKFSSYELSDNSIYALYRDKEEYIWVGTMSSIHRYDKRSKVFTSMKKTNSSVFDIAMDEKGRIWFATLGDGVLCYDEINNVWKEYLASEDKTGLPSSVVRSVYVDTESNVWVATEKGLARYNSAFDSFQFVPLDIPSQDITCIIGDKETLWLTTAVGLVRYDMADGCNVFTRDDGLLSNLFVENSGLITSDGRIYLGTVKGFNSFYPYKLHLNNVKPKVVFTGLEIFNKKVIAGDNPHLPVRIDALSQLDLKYNENVFSISFSALSYCATTKNQYAYFMDGFDTDWNYVGNQNKATYTNLPPGAYTLRVKASNNDGVWNEEGVALPIVIHPPLWLTPLFKIFYLLFVALILVRLVLFIVNREKRKHSANIQQIKMESSREIFDEKLRFITNIAHEIRTPLSLIIAPLERVISEKRKGADISEELSIMERNSQRLLSLVNQLLDFQKMEHDSEKRLFFEKYKIDELMNSIVETYEPFFQYHGVHFRLEEMSSFSAVVDKEAVVKIVSNLLTNAAKFAKDAVVLSCHVNEQDQNFQIIVSDDGNGIEKSEIENIFHPFYQVVQSTKEPPSGTGIGLSIVKKLVDAHNGTITVESEVGCGVSFIVLIPSNLPCSSSDSGMANSPIKSFPAMRIPPLTDIPVPENRDEREIALVVEDSKDMMGFLVKIFSDEYEVLSAPDGGQALEILKTQNVSIIICDLMMPHVNGIDLCRAVRANFYTSHIPIIMLSAKLDMGSRVEAISAGADIFIEKPFSVQYIKTCVRNHIDLRKSMIDKFSKTPVISIGTVAPNLADEKFLNEVNSIILDNLDNADFSVDSIVKHMGISRSGFFAKIKTLINLTPNELIQIVRLKKAGELLLENKYLISEIGYMVGFRNPSYFTKCFYKQFGVTPNEFIKNNQEHLS